MIAFPCCQSRVSGTSEVGEGVWSDSVAYYTEQIRQGNQKAYLNLARSYHEGTEGVELRSLRMFSVALAADRRGVLGAVQSVFEPLPDDDSVKKLYNVVKLVSEHQYDEALRHGDEFEEMGLPKELIEAFIMIDGEKWDEAAPMCETLAKRGCLIARVFAAYIVSERDSSEVDALLAVVDTFPLFYNRIARRCVAAKDAESAERFYSKADSCACLDKDGIAFLLKYHAALSSSGGKRDSAAELER